MSALGVSMDPEKVEAVMSWEIPKSVFELHRFLGLTRYYRMFIKTFPISCTYDEIDPEGGQV